MGLGTRLRLRLQRRRLQVRAIRKSRELTRRKTRASAELPTDGTLLFATTYNERIRLPFFLDYYRALGVRHFLIVDNASDDGSDEYLAEQPDVWLWSTTASYKRARFGTDWLNWLKLRYAHDRWTLTVDADEFLVYPFCDTRPIDALTDWLDRADVTSFGTLLLDMYPEGPVSEAIYGEGQDPLDVACWFDAGNYSYKPNPRHKNLWIQGGPRARVFFRDTPKAAPSLNKIPLVRWNRKYVYASSTHMLLPRGLNRVYDETGGEKASGALLHTKFLNTLGQKVEEEALRGQHYAAGREYAAYAASAKTGLWTDWSERYLGWQQLEQLGLISPGDWA